LQQRLGRFHIFSMTFYAREPNFNHSLILYSNTLDLKRMKWINLNTLWCDCYTMTNVLGP
jgi:hypothetical protein